MNKGSGTSELLPQPDAMSSILMLIRDWTDTGDAIPFQLHLAKTLSSNTPTSKALYLSTRSRTQYIPQDTSHIYPVPSRSIQSATASFSILDPYTIQTPDFSLSDLDMQMELTTRVIDAARKDACDIVVVECLHSLKMVFGVDPSAFVRSLLSSELKCNVMATCPTRCGIDEDIRSLSHLASFIHDLSDLQTGVAADVDGVVRVAKEHGRWKPESVPKRYLLTDSALILNS